MARRKWQEGYKTAELDAHTKEHIDMDPRRSDGYTQHWGFNLTSVLEHRSYLIYQEPQSDDKSTLVPD